MKNELQVVEKVFENKQIRTIWSREEEKFYISVVDMIEILTDSTEPRKYWNWLKNKLLKEDQFETSNITRQLKLIAKDGKNRLTDVVDIEGMFRIIESIPSKKAEPIKLWLAILTNILTKVWCGYSVKEYKEFKNLKKENLRDNMTNMELVLNMLAEVSTTEISKSSKESEYSNVKNSILKSVNVAKNAKEQIKIAEKYWNQTSNEIEEYLFYGQAKVIDIDYI